MAKLIDAWKNKGQILEGFLNSVFKKEDVEAVADSRFAICKSCPLIDLEGSKCLVPSTQPCCSGCGCSLHMKTRSLSSSCPEGKWAAMVEEFEEDIINSKLNETED